MSGGDVESPVPFHWDTVVGRLVAAPPPDPPGLCGPMCDTPHMATNLSIDPKLLEEALELSGERTKTAAVVRALKEFIARRRQKGILDLFGKLDWNPDFEPKRERSRR